ncbi:sensor histidine kinase KdpD [Phenylobacterium sp.]|uniref:sensor histidine kinase n=1 Tax=Phenylobacterium sp. TaxID=1871053 RepID=UPI0025FB38F1|nr:HAMP domain-containing sensor histidine kinase [Phenylobacterium sp.]MBX3482727.1 HAMP domain-containing histidine kinase [Phenylobacterium sp.]
MSRPPPAQLRPGRLVLALVVAAVAALLAGVGLIDAVGERIIAERQREVAASARDYFVAFAHVEGLAPLARALDRKERAHAVEGFRYAVFANDGALLGGVRLLPWSQLPPPGLTQVQIRENGKPSPWSVLVQPIATGGTLVVYEDLTERTRLRQTFAVGAGVSLAVALGALLAVSLWIARVVYTRAEAIARTAGDIAAGKTSARAPSTPGGDVFDRLGGAINAMLDRNEELMTGLQMVTDSLAHDLRSPLTRMKGSLSRALDAGIDDAARIELIGQAWDQADQALATAGALLDIARAETGVSRDMFQPVDLGALLEEVADLFAPVVEDAGQTLHVAPARNVTLEGHEVLLRQAIGNLIHNAARHAGSGARVEVRVAADGDGVRCIVADDGPGIPEADRGRVVERFVRLDRARTTSGSGLGLAIAAACAKLHRGRLLLEDNAPGLRVVLELSRA